MSPVACRECGDASNAAVVCEGCGTLRSPAEVEAADFFALFGLPPAYEVPRAALEKAYVSLARKLHPDRGGREAAATLRRIAARVNEAYAVLKDPVKRAAYLVDLRGGDAARTAKVSPLFLQEQLALREAAEQAGAEELAALRSTAERRLADYQGALAAALASTEPAPEQMLDARRMLNEMNFFRTFLRDLEGGAR